MLIDNLIYNRKLGGDSTLCVIVEKKSKLFQRSIPMKKYIKILLILFCTVGLFGCNNTTTISESKSEIVSADYGKVIELAKAEFAEIFKEFEDIQIDETSTMTRTDDAKQIVVQIRYSSSNGSGVYGFEYGFDHDDNLELIRHGDDVTIDNLLK